MKKIRVYVSVFFMLLIVFSVVGCSKKESPEEPEENVEEIVIEEAEEVVEEIPDNQNLLTGVCDLSENAIGKRPVAVMVNNMEAALPQYGVAAADVIFEIVVEGDHTRFMALYGDFTKVPQICSVRSCRKYFPIIAKGFDAVYVHWGMDGSIIPYVDSLEITRYDGMANTGGLYGRDQARLNAGYALEHTSYFDGTRLPETMVQRGERTDLVESKKGTAFLFNGLAEQIKPEGNACTKIDIDFGATTATLTYDTAANTYLKQINGKAQMDGVVGTQLAFTNVFILETSIGIDEINGVHRKFDWTGGMDSVGYYISNGTMQKVHWVKEDIDSYLRFFDENGEEIAINRGKTYIAINHLGQATFE